LEGRTEDGQKLRRVDHGLLLDFRNREARLDDLTAKFDGFDGFVEIGWGEVNSGVEVVKPEVGILAYRIWLREGCGQVHHREKAEGGFVMRR